jgi:hypothetical protein
MPASGGGEVQGPDCFFFCSGVIFWVHGMQIMLPFIILTTIFRYYDYYLTELVLTGVFGYLS